MAPAKADNMTDAALAALREQGFSRRQFSRVRRAHRRLQRREFAEKLGISPEKMLAQGGNTRRRSIRGLRSAPTAT